EGVRRQVDAALELRDAGELPAVDKGTQSLTVVHRSAQLDRVRRIEDVAAVKGFRTVIVGQIELVRAHQAEGLAVRVIEGHVVAALLPNPGHLQTVVIGVLVVVGEVERLVDRVRTVRVLTTVVQRGRILANLEESAIRYDVDVGPHSGLVQLILALIPYVGYFEERRKRHPLGDGKTVAGGERAMVVGRADRACAERLSAGHKRLELPKRKGPGAG